MSGEAAESVGITTYLHAKGASEPKTLNTKDKKGIADLIPLADYIEHATFDPTVQQLRYEELMAFSRELHEFMRDHAKLTESEKPLLVSGTLIALRNKAFAASFDKYLPEDLQTQWMRVIRDEINKADIPKAKKDKMVQPYSGIARSPGTGAGDIAVPEGGATRTHSAA